MPASLPVANALSLFPRNPHWPVSIWPSEGRMQRKQPQHHSVRILLRPGWSLATPAQGPPSPLNTLSLWPPLGAHATWAGHAAKVFSKRGAPLLPQNRLSSSDSLGEGVSFRGPCLYPRKGVCTRVPGELWVGGRGGACPPPVFQCSSPSRTGRASGGLLSTGLAGTAPPAPE